MIHQLLKWANERGTQRSWKIANEDYGSGRQIVHLHLLDGARSISADLSTESILDGKFDLMLHTVNELIRKLAEGQSE